MSGTAADPLVGQHDRLRRMGAGCCQAIDIAGNIDRLAADTEGREAAGTGAIRSQGNRRGAALGAGAAGIHADAKIAVVSRARGQQAKVAGSGNVPVVPLKLALRPSLKPSLAAVLVRLNS